MKQDTYQVEVAFTQENIIACSCTCKAGALDSERVLCVHVLPVLFLISQEMFKHLLEHILYEWADYVSQQDNRGNFTETEVLQLGNCLRTLIPLEKNYMIDNTKSTFELLYDFSVQTEKRKETRLPKNPILCVHRPLCDLDFSSTLRQAMRNISNNSNEEQGLLENLSDISNVQSNCTTYQNIVILCASFLKAIKSQHNGAHMKTLIGFNILQHRSEMSYNKIDDVPVDNHIHKEVKKLCEIANSKTRSSQKKKTTNVVLTTPINENNMQASVEDEENIISPVEEPLIRKKRFCCSVCQRSERVDPSISFTRVPIVTIKKPQVTKTSNKIRMTYYKNMFRRNIYIERLKLRDKKEHTYLVFCSEHIMVKEKFDNIPWIDKVGMKNYMYNVYLVVPDIERRNNICTRSQASNVLPVEPRKKRMVRQRTVLTRHSPIKKRVRLGRQCNFVKCKCNAYTPGARFKRIPPQSKNTTSSCEGRNIEIFRIAVKQSFRLECLRRVGIKRNDKRKDLRICNQHTIEEVEYPVRYTNLKGERKTINVTMNLPSARGISDSPTTTSNGLGTHRENMRLIPMAIDLLQEFGGSTNEAIRSILSQSMEDIDEFDNRAIGTDMMKIRSEFRKNKGRNEETVVRLNGLNDNNVRIRTGFPSLTCLLCFIVIVYEGKVENFHKTITHMDWLEEWMIYFEIIYMEKR